MWVIDDDCVGCLGGWGRSMRHTVQQIFVVLSLAPVSFMSRVVCVVCAGAAWSVLQHYSQCGWLPSPFRSVPSVLFRRAFCMGLRGLFSGCLSSRLSVCPFVYPFVGVVWMLSRVSSGCVCRVLADGCTLRFSHLIFSSLVCVCVCVSVLRGCVCLRATVEPAIPSVGHRPNVQST